MLVALRRYIFWSLDLLQGGRFKKHFTDVKGLNEDLIGSKSKRNAYLSDLLKYSSQTCSYYKAIDASLGLSAFPVVNKNTIRDHFELIKSSKFKIAEGYKVSTSGSTGTPFTTYLDQNKRVRNSVDTIYFASKAGFELGEKLVYIRLWDEQHKKSKFHYWKQNIISQDITKLTDDDIKALLNRLQSDTTRKGFLAYASAFDAICNYLDRIKSKPIDCNVVSIIAISESLSDYARTRMLYYFNCEVVSRYSASETGIIAQQPIGKSYFSINWASYELEILKMEEDVPAKFGELGRIVITDLFNYAVPMIRYDTGDLGVLEELDNIPVLTRVEGRKMDMIYNTNGEVVTSHIVHQICLFEGIIHYQLVQETDKNYVFIINATDQFKEEDELVQLYKNYLGPNANISIKRVDNIPLLSSGKRKKVINKHYT